MAIIGYTRSDKAVFNHTYEAPDWHYEAFTSDDHKDAAEIHSKLGNKLAVKAHKACAKYEEKEEEKEFGVI